MTAQIFSFERKPTQPVNQPPHRAADTRARIAPVNRLSTEDEVRMKGWAEEKFRDAIRVYRAMFSAEELASRLTKAADDELRLIESTK
jgi:hypothetical protein